MFADLFPLTDAGAVFAVLLLLVLVGPMLVRPLRLPDLVGLIALGMVVGPNVLGIVSGQVLIHALGFVGLLYLMFQGGLDLDLEGFVERRRASILFGTVTFVLPMLVVTGVSLAIGVPFLAAVIIGSALTSHTPLSYPTIARYDLARNPAVTASLGATLLATVAALLVLAVASAGAEGNQGVGYWLLFTAGMVLYVGAMLLGVPRFTRWFFRGLGQDREVRLTYLLSGMGLAAVVAGAIGIEPIVGAFLAGLAFNRFVPDGTVIADRVAFLGRSLFIPAFLISTGMMLDPVALVTDPATLTLGVALVAAEVVSKWGASTVSGRWLGFTANERGLMFSLSVGQAAGALAAVVVGQELGLLGTAEVNAIILVIMVTALLAGVSANRHAPQVPPPGTEGRSLGKRVVVPVSNPDTIESLVRVAGQVAAPDSGAVVAVNVLPFDAAPEQVRANRELASRAERAALAVGSEVNTSVRIDASIDGGVLHSVVEQDGTCLVMGWEGQSRRRGSLFGSVIDRCVAISPVPVLVCRPGIDEPTRRVVLVVTSDEVGFGHDRGLVLAAEVVGRLTRQAEVPSLVVTDLPEDELRHRLDHRIRPSEIVTEPTVLRALASRVREGDVVLAVTPPATSRLGRGAHRVAQAARGRTVVVVVPR
ncbi:cation:proton antiporter [Egicoccus sp. AB-alg2]|uniref:cation:proton antiporter domain-containing protein n=1 Tax=Egicoccus sp. AB-alg2 TaxID=3242693 RepID=UPI00359D375D